MALDPQPSPLLCSPQPRSKDPGRDALRRIRDEQRARDAERHRRRARTGSDVEGTDESKVLITPCDPWPKPYFLHDGLRRVEPYHFTYNTWCKARWRGREIFDVFNEEFRDRGPAYYRKAMEQGNIHLNGLPVPSPRHIVQNGDLISHTTHRHEPPVTAAPIAIVHESSDMLVISKPAGIPVHPAGRYNHNSVTAILRSERGPGFQALPCNRLDRLTSGVMFIAKHRAAAERMTAQLTERSVRKEYVCRVVGEFPSTEVECEQPILQISPKLGLNRVRADGKSARTVFRRVAFYPGKGKGKGESVVLARPFTGRTHQIRVHLQYLGHPIANDPIYANARVFGPDLGAWAESRPEEDEDIMARLGRMGKDQVAEAVAWHEEMVGDYQKRKKEKLSGEVCEICGTELYTDPGVEELGIWLHARRYEDAEGRWGYETGLPDWALPKEGEEVVLDEGAEELFGSGAKAVGDLEKALEETKLDGEETLAGK